eukprot:767303-Hanusia_phi.AAC.3
MTEKTVILRSGSWSIYNALTECCPWTIRNQDPITGRCGLTEIEFNKTLEKDGFKKIRDRSSSFKWLEHIEEIDMKSDCYARPALTVHADARYFFAGRRWKNPDVHSDYLELKQGWEAICASSPYASLSLGGRCSFQNFISVCRKYHNGWNCIIRCVQRPLKRKIPGFLPGCNEQGKKAKKACGGRILKSWGAGTAVKESSCAKESDDNSSSSSDLGGMRQELKTEPCFALADSVEEEEEYLDKDCFPPAHRTGLKSTSSSSMSPSCSELDQDDCLSALHADGEYGTKLNVCIDSILQSSLASYFFSGQQDVQNFVEEIGEEMKESKGGMSLALGNDDALVPMDSSSLEDWL